MEAERSRRTPNPEALWPPEPGGEEGPSGEPLQASMALLLASGREHKASGVDPSGCGHSTQPPRKSCGCLLWASSPQNLSATSQTLLSGSATWQPSL